MAVDDGRKLVVIPAYNEKEFIREVLKALKPLTERADYEVVVVDDGSTDRTAEAAKAEGYQVLSHSENLGKTQAVLTGVKYARENDFKFIATIDADTSNLNPEMVEALINPLKEVHEDGRPKKLMSVAHMQEGESQMPPSAYDLRYCGQRAFRVSAFDPYFNGNKKWLEYLRVRWPEPAFNRLFSEGQRLFLPDLTFKHRWTFHGGDRAVYERFMEEQADSVNYSDRLYNLRGGIAMRLRDIREDRDQGDAANYQQGLEETKVMLRRENQKLQNMYLPPPAEQKPTNKPPSQKKSNRN